jgi:hypothetical protein
MSFRTLFNRLMSGPNPDRRRPAAPRARNCRLAVETLEDRLTPTAMLTITDAYIWEGNDGAQNARVTVSLTEPHGNNVTVDYRTVNGSAVAGSDFTAASGKLTFAKNEMTKSIVVPIKGDRLVESDEYLSVQLSNAKGAKIADGTGFVSIADDEPRIYVSDAWATEGNAGTTAMTFSVSLSGEYDRPVTVNFTTADGTATGGGDYVALPGSVTFDPGQATTQEITVQVKGDLAPELNETFLVNLTTPNSYAQLTRSTATGTILDDEPHLIISDATQDYYGSTITFYVSLSVPATDLVKVDFTTVDGSAVAGTDYVAQGGTLTFQPGETVQMITIELLNFDPAEKSFSIHFSNASPNALLTYQGANGYWYYDYGWGWYDPGYVYYDSYYGY